MRRLYVAGNWKMNLTLAEARALIEGIRAGLPKDPPVDVAVFPPFVQLAPLADALEGSACIRRGEADVRHELLCARASGRRRVGRGGEQLHAAAVPHVQQHDWAIRRAEFCDELHTEDVTVQPQRFLPITRLEGKMVHATALNDGVLGSNRHSSSSLSHYGIVMPWPTATAPKGRR